MPSREALIMVSDSMPSSADVSGAPRTLPRAQAVPSCYRRGQCSCSRSRWRRQGHRRAPTAGQAPPSAHTSEPGRPEHRPTRAPREGTERWGGNGRGCFVCLACRRGECVKPWVARVAYIIHVKLETTHPDRTEIEPGLGRQGSQCTEDAYRFISSWLTCHSCVLSSNSP